MKISYKLDISLYKLPKGPSVPDQIVKEGYDIRRAIKNVMLSHNQRHNGFRYYTISKVANKVANCKEDIIILNVSEYEIIKESFDRYTEFGPGDDELVRRIYEAEKIEEKI